MLDFDARFRLSLLSALGVLLASASMACSSPSSPDLPPEMLGAGSTSAGLPTTSASASSTGSGSLFGGVGGGGYAAASGTGSTGQGVGGASQACAASPYKAAQLPLDMYIMLDQSKSMNEMTAGGPTKWTAVTHAIQGFVLQQGSTDVSVGIQYFGHPVIGSDKTTDSCDAADYTVPEVEIAPLPGVADDIVNSMSMHGPSTSTPTSAALQGAVDHGAAWAANNPGHVVVAVLATDGKPNECDKKTSDMAATAAAGLSGSPSVKTFGIGVFAPSDIPSGPNVLNAIAAAGGTDQAFVIDTNDPSTDVEAQFLAALNTIRGSALGCQYSIPVPTSGTADFAKVNIQYTPGGSDTPEALLQYANKASCPAKGDGWYYDSNTAPTQILLCDPTCKKVSSDAAAALEVLIGCTTMVAPQ